MSFLKKLGKGLKKAGKGVQKGARVVMTPVRAVERVVRPIGKRIPIVGTFAQLHEDFGEKFEAKALGIKGEKKSKLEKTLSSITEPAAKLADNSTYKSVNQAYGGNIPAPYKSYMMAVSADPALVGATLQEALLAPSGKGLQLNGKTLLPGSPGYAAIAKVGKEAQVKTMKDMVVLASKGDPNAKRALNVLKAANPKLYASLSKEADSKVFDSVHSKVTGMLSPEAKKLVNASIKTHPVIHAGIPAMMLAAQREKISTQLTTQAKAGNTGAQAAITVVNALRAAQDGKPDAAIALLQANQKRASEVQAGGSLKVAPSTFYRVITPSGRVVTLPKKDVEGRA